MKRTMLLPILVILFALMGGMIYVSMNGGHQDPEPPVSKAEYVLKEFSVLDEIAIEKSIDYVSYDLPRGTPGEPFVGSDYVWVQLTYDLKCVNSGIGLPMVHTSGYINVTWFDDNYSRIAVGSQWISMTEHPGNSYVGEVTLNYLVPTIIDDHMNPIDNEDVTLDDLDLKYPSNWRSKI